MRLLFYTTGGILSLIALVRLWRNIQRRTEHARNLKRDLDSAEDRLQALQQAIQAKEDVRDNAMRSLTDATRELGDIQEELAQVRSSNRALEEKLAELDELRAEKQPAPAPGPAVNVLSDDDIIQGVESLNNDICRVANLVAEFFVHDSAEIDPPSTEVLERATEVVGPTMLSLLQSERDIGPLARIACQSAMTAYTDWMISSWYYERPENEVFLSELYNRIREQEEQAVAGRWRQLTRLHVQRMLSDEPTFEHFFVDAFKNIMLAVGIRSLGEQEEVMVDALKTIVQRARELNHIFGGAITSKDLEPVYIAPESALFDPTIMTDIYFVAGEEESTMLKKGKGKSKEETVLSTIGLGEDRDLREQVLLRPKVVRLSTLKQPQDRMAGNLLDGIDSSVPVA
ncbi:hypothetical protein FISHEDRAFT_60615 [Fistulina hepatica ATCC 64428]|uniref:Uncharacterized protein n=1 Tax=Fistulina hepatica ATCC 64428 TaxID=1128425 RepID=A0A0D7A535_9AGAR|nr:hypothetical protein FISHEDRAFT_60615 [Fistulina hepatica ATCC 64428]